MYDMSHLMRYYRSLDAQGKEKLLYVLGQQLAEARARIWLSEVKYGHEIASKAAQNKEYLSE